MGARCIDVSFPDYTVQWYFNPDISITAPSSHQQIVVGQWNTIEVTLQSTSGASASTNMYVGSPGSQNNCLTNQAQLMLLGNVNTIIFPSVPAGGQASVQTTFAPAPGWGSPRMIGAKCVVDEDGACFVGEAPGWDLTNNTPARIAAHRFPIVTQAMFQQQILVLLPTSADYTEAAFALAFPFDNTATRTRVRAVVVPAAEESPCDSDERRDLIVQYERNAGRVWSASPTVKLALGVESEHRAVRAHGRPISPEMWRHLSRGSEHQSGTDVSIELPLAEGEIQALIEVPVPPGGKFYVVRLLHENLDTTEILQQWTFIVEPESDLRATATGRPVGVAGEAQS